MKLFHGTLAVNKESIFAHGLLPGKDGYVYFTERRKIAMRMALRKAECGQISLFEARLPRRFRRQLTPDPYLAAVKCYRLSFPIGSEFIWWLGDFYG